MHTPFLFVQYRIAFRFEEIREVVHIMTEDRGDKKNVPRPHQLSLNYRSHSGIVALGKAVVELLKNNFGIDFMAKPDVAALKGRRWLCLWACKARSSRFKEGIKSNGFKSPNRC